MSQTVLPSWNEGHAKDSILAFVDRVTSDGSGFVRPAERIAAFDNDGTLWVEQRLPPQFDFVFGTWAEEVRQDPSLASRQPYQALLGSLDLGPGKPEHIFAHTGRLPLLAGGNADVDIEMLSAAPFALLVSHDDAGREYAYTAAAEASLATAAELGWTVVSMKDDWNTIFSERGIGA
jgi:hypothetical protein